MYQVSVRSKFSAVHSLLLADGQYEPSHGHNWSVEARFAGPELDATGILVDFREVQAALRKVLGQLHHADLNGSALLGGLNPSAENVARAICAALAADVPCPQMLESVCVEEAPGCTATYFPGACNPVSRAACPVDDNKRDR